MKDLVILVAAGLIGLATIGIVAKKYSGSCPP